MEDIIYKNSFWFYFYSRTSNQFKEQLESFPLSFSPLSASCSTHADPLLYHLQDEGKCPPLEVIKLEGAEVDMDSSLGKPFVFNCVPQPKNRTFCLCATSNQEMKR